MGVIGKLIGGIFAFLGGIFKSIGKVVGIGKSDYYMEAPASVGAPAKLEAAKAEAVKIPAKVEAAKTEAKTETKAATAVQEAPAKADLTPEPLETVKAAIAEAPASGAANGKANGKKTRKAKAEADSLPAPVKTADTAPKTDQTFAPNYLIQTSGSRRRPGPSLDPFRNLAKQVKS